MADEIKPEENIDKPKFKPYLREERRATFKEAWEDLNPSVKKLESYKNVKKIARKYYKKEQEGQTDLLTQILNRTGVKKRLEIEVKKAKRHNLEIEPKKEETNLFIFFLDLNNLKEHNTVSNATGDRLLKNTALALSEEARPTDIIGRWGGDEFIVILPETDLEGAQAYWTRKSVDLKNFSVWISAGLAKANLDNIDESINNAEEAMRQAKKLSKERFVKIGLRENLLQTSQDTSTIATT